MGSLPVHDGASQLTSGLIARLAGPFKRRAGIGSRSGLHARLAWFMCLLFPLTVQAQIDSLRASSSPPNSQLIGGIVQFEPRFSASSQLEFQYRLKPPTNRSQYLLRDWGTANWAWNTSGLAPGRYVLQLRAREIGSSVVYEAIAYKSIELVTKEPVKSVEFSPRPNATGLVGEPVSLVANAISPVPVEYRYLIKRPGETSYGVAREWGENSWVWETEGTPAGSYRILVRARNIGSEAQTYEAEKLLHYTLVQQPPLNSLSVQTNNLRSPQTVGVAVEFEAATGQAAGVEYKYLMRRLEATRLELARDWGSARWNWETLGLEPGIYIFEVRARNIGNTAPFEVKKTTGFRLFDLQFEETTEEAGLTYVGESWGGAWGDVNGDLLPDIWVTNHRKKPALFINKGDGSFVNRVDEYWNSPTTDAHGTAWADFDNDGDQDLIQVAGGGQGIRETRPGHYNQLFVNQGGAFFEDAVIRNLSYETARGRNVTWVDWNSDSLLDMFFTVENNGDNPPNKLFVQELNGTFSDVSEMLEIPPSARGWYAMVAHIGTEPDVQLLVGDWRFPRYVYPSFINLASDTLDVSVLGNVSDIAVGDFDGDLVTDIFVARNKFPRQVYARKSDFRLDFALSVKDDNHAGIAVGGIYNVSLDLVVPAVRASGIHIGAGGYSFDDFEYIQKDGASPPAAIEFSLDSRDPRTWGVSDFTANEFGIYIGYDQQTGEWILLSHNNSAPDRGTIFGSIFSTEPIGQIREINFEPQAVKPKDILLSGTDDSELLLATDVGLEKNTASRSVVAGDFDNDMDLDVYVQQSSRIQNLPNILYVNQGDGTFQELVGAAGAAGTEEGTGEAVIAADYDFDGFLDLLVFNGRGEPPFNNGPVQLFRNKGNTNNWLEIDLDGVHSNRDGIGASVTLITPNGKKQSRERDGGMHLHGQNHKRLHFGLSVHTSASIIVRWPSGIVQKVRNAAANQLLHIVEAEY